MSYLYSLLSNKCASKASDKAYREGVFWKKKDSINPSNQPPKFNPATTPASQKSNVSQTEKKAKPKKVPENSRFQTREFFQYFSFVSPKPYLLTACPKAKNQIPIHQNWNIISAQTSTIMKPKNAIPIGESPDLIALS